VKKFNAFQILVLFVSLPLLIAYVWHLGFMGCGLVGAVLSAGYIALGILIWEAIYKHTLGG
jgi:uncharacterized membrane protein (DUF485 family)